MNIQIAIFVVAILTAIHTQWMLRRQEEKLRLKIIVLGIQTLLLPGYLCAAHYSPNAGLVILALLATDLGMWIKSIQLSYFSEGA
jgi:hypothetical protein